MADIDVGFYPQAPAPGQMFDIAGKVIGNQLLGTQAKQANQDLRLQQLNILRSALGAIAADPNANYNSFAGLKTLVDQGLVSPDFYQAEMAKVPQSADPGAYHQLANQYNAQLATVGERYAMENGMPLGQANLPTSYTDASGATVPTTFGQYPQDIGLGNGTQSNPLMTPGGGGTPANPFLPAAAPAAEAPTAPVALGGPERVVGPTASELKTWEASTDQFAADRANAAQWAQRVTPLEKLNDLFESDVLTGKGSNIVSDLSKVAATFGIPIEGAQDQATLISEIDKYASQLARNSGAAGNTDNQLAISITANPSASMDKMAARDVTKVLLGLERFNQGKILAAQASGVDPRQYADFAVNWGANIDPRAFAFDLMSPEAKGKLVNGMSDKEFEKFQQSLSTATQLGLVTPPGAGGGQ